MLNFEEVKSIFHELYVSIDGHAISTFARRKISSYDKSLTYGEVTPESFKKILEVTKSRNDQVFYDLGSGTGKAVILASLLGSFTKVVGIELLPELYEASNKVLSRLLKKFQTGIANKKISFINENFLKYDFSDADVIFAHSTCFTDEIMLDIAKKAESLKKGSRVITVTKWLDSLEYRLIERFEYPFTWGNGTVSIYEKIT